LKNPKKASTFTVSVSLFNYRERYWFALEKGLYIRKQNNVSSINICKRTTYEIAAKKSRFSSQDFWFFTTLVAEALFSNRSGKDI
jgi:hypothetical protein